MIPEGVMSFYKCQNRAVWTLFKCDQTVSPRSCEMTCNESLRSMQLQVFKYRLCSTFSGCNICYLLILVIEMIPDWLQVVLHVEWGSFILERKRRLSNEVQRDDIHEFKVTDRSFEVWGKVMFSQAFVSISGHWGGCLWKRVCMEGGYVWRGSAC